MSSVEAKVDMSLDELISTRRASEKKQTKRRKRTPAKASPKVDKAVVQQTSNRMKRQNQIAKRRGLATSNDSATETQKKAQKAVKVKTTTVTLGKKQRKQQARGAAASTGSDIPKTFSIEPTTTSRPVSIKDFVLPKDTKMTISFTTKKAGKNSAETTKTVTIAGNANIDRRATASKKANRAAKLADNMDTSNDKANKPRRGRRGAGPK